MQHKTNFEENDLSSLSVKDHIASITLNRPKQYNALSRPMIASVSAILDKVNEDKDIHVVVLAANGPGFCAGHDLKEIRENRK